MYINIFIEYILYIGESPYWLTVAHHISLSLIGSANAFVWSQSKTFRSIATSVKNLRENDKQDDVEDWVKRVKNGL